MKEKNLSVRCSVVMASFNGDRFIKDQIESVIQNLDSNDELIISDDGSTDLTCDIIKEFVNHDNRIKLIDGPHRGVIFNYENAINHAQGKYIFLCDQDDIWVSNKITTALNYLSKHKYCVLLHDAYMLYDDTVSDISFQNQRKCKNGVLFNLMKNGYIGCCMCFTRDLIPYILPFPQNICMHDQWIGLIAEIIGKSIIINDRLIYYRRHDSNLSPIKSSNSYSTKIKNRTHMITALIKRLIIERRRHK